MRIDQEPYVHELVREEHTIIVLKCSSHSECAGGGVDLAVEGFDLSDGELLLVRAIVSIGFKLSTAMYRFHNLRNGILSDVELDGDGLQLGDNYERGRSVSLDNITRIYQAQTYPAVDRRGNVTIGQIYLRLVQVTLVQLYCPFELMIIRGLRVKFLLRDYALAQQLRVSLKIDLREFKLSLIACQLSLRLSHRSLKRSRIDLQ